MLARTSLLLPLIAAACRGPAPVDPLEPPPDAERRIERLDKAEEAEASGSVHYEVLVRDGERQERWYLTIRTGPFSWPDGWSATAHLDSAGGGSEPRQISRLDVKSAKVLVRRPGKPEISSWMKMPCFPLRACLFFLASSDKALEAVRTRSAFEPRELLPVLGPSVLLDAWKGNEALAPLLAELVGRPPLRLYWKTLMAGEVRMTLDSPRVVGADTFLLGENGPVPTVRISQEIKVFDEVVMDLEFEAAEPRPPMDLTLGLVRLTGRSRTDRDRSIEVRLIGAARDGGEPLRPGERISMPVL